MGSETTPSDGSAATDKNRYPGLVLWLITTALLAVPVALLAWHLNSRQPAIVEVTGPTPPPAAPAIELVHRADQLTQLIALRENQLIAAIAGLDPPACEPGEVIDEDRLDAVRQAHADDLSRWQAILERATPSRG
ncbi:MAG: hypothetical protein ACFB6S_13490 [Geminicoccaceae bacterium]